jgi:hypothetical protein
MVRSHFLILLALYIDGARNPPIFSISMSIYQKPLVNIS